MSIQGSWRHNSLHHDPRLGRCLSPRASSLLMLLCSFQLSRDFRPTPVSSSSWSGQVIGAWSVFSHWSNSTGTGCELQALCCAQVSETATQGVLNGLQLKLKVHKPLAAESCYSSVLEVPGRMNAHRAVVCLHMDIALPTDSPRLRSTFSMSSSVSP